MTHESINRIVRERYDGNWLPIIDRLLDELETLEAAMAGGATYAVPRTARTLGGKELETYLDQMRLSVLILQCLARKDQASACPFFPNVLWWGDLSHDSVTRHVQDHYGGNWFPVVDMLLDELEIMERAKARKEVYAVPGTERRLRDEGLEIYIKQTERAVVVLQCLAAKTNNVFSFRTRAGPCPPFPHLEGWEDMTHASAVRLVKERHNGDWTSLIDVFLDDLDHMEQAKARGDPYVAPKTARRLVGQDLDARIDRTRAMVLALKCLARKDRIAAAERAGAPVPFIPVTSFRTRYETYRTQIDTGVRRETIIVTPPPVVPEKKVIRR